MPLLYEIFSQVIIIGIKQDPNYMVAGIRRNKMKVTQAPTIENLIGEIENTVSAKDAKIVREVLTVEMVEPLSSDNLDVTEFFEPETKCPSNPGDTFAGLEKRRRLVRSAELVVEKNQNTSQSRAGVILRHMIRFKNILHAPVTCNFLGEPLTIEFNDTDKDAVSKAQKLYDSIIQRRMQPSESVGLSEPVRGNNGSTSTHTSIYPKQNL